MVNYNVYIYKLLCFLKTTYYVLFLPKVDKNANPMPIDTHDGVINETEKNTNPTPIDTRDEVVNEAEKNVNPTRTDAYDNHVSIDLHAIN